MSLTPILLRITAPFFQHSAEVFGQLGLELNHFSSDGMLEAQRLSMQRLSWHEGEAVADELLVLGDGGAFEDAVATIRFVVEERVPDVLQMHANLVRATGLQLAFDEG